MQIVSKRPGSKRRSAYQWLKFVSNLFKKSRRFAIPGSSSFASAAAIAWLTDFENDAEYSANVEHVVNNLE